MAKKFLPVGISNFRDIIKNNFVYVDKTKWIYELVRIPKGFYFLSRPRRFGKSLTVSTLDALFSGEKELFKGLYIYNKWNFKKHTVLRLNMTALNIDSPEDFKKSLSEFVDGLAEKFDISLKKSQYNTKFGELIDKLSNRGELVILIDEYDYPILEHLTKDDISSMREILSNFYVQLKENEDKIRFLFITGISKFSKVSIFSKLNHLNDITLDAEFSTFLGYREEEISKFYRDYIEEVKKKFNMSEAQFWQKLREWYNGYSWDGKNKVYNPYSITLFFSKKEFQNYWFETGTPTFLIKVVKYKGVSELEANRLTESDINLSITEFEQVNLGSFLWQSGYYTIKKIEQVGNKRIYFVDFPNYEVKSSFSESLLKEFVKEDRLVSDLAINLLHAFETENWQEFIEEINRLFANITYYQYKDLEDYQKEAFWHVMLQLILSSVFPIVESERPTYRGRLDLIVSHNNKTLILEVKTDKSAKQGLQQIESRDYARAYKNPIIMAININTEKKQIDDFIVKRM